MEKESKKNSMSSALPIILAHGITPFDKVIFPFLKLDNRENDHFHYFRKIRSSLMANGFLAFHSRVGWASGVDKRSSDLLKEIRRITEDFSKWPRVHIIAHSMGGLDARHMIYHHRMEDRIASLTTIGTPHLGTSFADWGLERLGFLIDIARPIGLDLEGFKDLTRESCNRFNQRTSDFEENSGVLYQTFAGTQPLNKIFRPLRFAARIIEQEEGENDGLVSLLSAIWKEEYFVERIDADHLNLIGWWDRSKGSTGVSRDDFEQSIREVYLRIARGLAYLR